ncbi:MAG: universal stress protein [Solirubrobacterales bacterium]|nr:universal stress protein [Solirubrobacterales bacterium]
MILIAYDGSDDAKPAARAAGELFPGQPATVVHVFVKFSSTRMATRTGIKVLVDADAADAAQLEDATEIAKEGAELALAGGLASAKPLAVPADPDIAETILAEADKLDARAIVIGSRGLSTLAALLLGSAANAVVHHSDRPVVVVPA